MDVRCAKVYLHELPIEADAPERQQSQGVRTMLLVFHGVGQQEQQVMFRSASQHFEGHGNRAILFYMGMLPGFFDLTVLTWKDIVAICTVSFLVPLFGNLVLAAFIHRAKAFMTSPAALRRTNITAGVLLILVGLLIPFL